MKTVIQSEDLLAGFSLSNWHANGARSITNQNTLLLEYNANNNNSNHYYDPNLPDTDWEIHINADFDTTNNISIWYSNTVNGSVTLTQKSNSTMIQERTLVNGSQQITNTTTLDNVTSSTNTVNNITIRREGTSIFFEYISNDTGDLVSYEKEYTSLDTNGRLDIQTEIGASVELSSLVLIGGGTISRIQLPIWNQSLLESYTDDSQQQGHTSYTMNNDGTINVGQREWILYPITLDTSKEYTIYTYNTQRYDNVGIILYDGTNYLNNYGKALFVLNTDSTSINGVNKTRIFFNESKMYYQLNSNAPIQISNTPTGYSQYYLGTRAILTDEILLAITEQTNGGGAITDKYSITKQADNDSHPFTHDTFTEEQTGKPTINADGTLKVGTGFITDWFRYEEDEDWIINTEIKINTLDTSQMLIATENIGDGHNFGNWNIHGKWIDYNDNTESGSTRIRLDQISYDNGSTLRCTIQRDGNTVTWKITDDNGNTQTVTLQNITQTSNTRFAMRCHGTTTDIDILNYTRLTKIEEER